MSSSTLTAGMLNGLTGDEAGTPKTAEAGSGSTSSATASTRSTTSAVTQDVSAEVRFGSVNWDREKRSRRADPRRSVDVPLTTQDRFRAVPWDPAQQALPAAIQSEEEIQDAENREAALSVKSFFEQARW